MSQGLYASLPVPVNRGLAALNEECAEILKADNKEKWVDDVHIYFFIQYAVRLLLFSSVWRAGH